MGNGMWNGGMKWRQEAATGGGATGGDRGRQEATPRPPTPSMRGLDDMVLGAVMAVEVAVLQFRNLFELFNLLMVTYSQKNYFLVCSSLPR